MSNSPRGVIVKDKSPSKSPQFTEAIRVVDWNSPEALDARVQGVRGQAEGRRTFSPPMKRGTSGSCAPNSNPWKDAFAPLLKCLYGDPWKLEAGWRAKRLRDEVAMVA
jgi:hypothetical protein